MLVGDNWWKCLTVPAKLNLGAAGSLYQKLAQGTEGYAGAVPIIHQAVAVKAAIDALDAGFQESADPN